MKCKNPSSHTYFTIANGISGSPKMLLVSWKDSDADFLVDKTDIIDLRVFIAVSVCTHQEET